MITRRQHGVFARTGGLSRSALGMLLLVALIFGATLAGRALVGRARRATLVAPLPLGPLRVAAVTAPGTSYEHLALDAEAGHLVALAGAVPRGCPPTGACDLGSAATAFVVLDGTTGVVLSSVALDGPAAAAAQATLLLADPTTHSAYAIAPDEVTRFSTADGHVEGSFATPTTLGGTIDGGALDSAHGTLALAGATTLVVLDAPTGAVRATLTVHNLIAGPVLDLATGRLFVLTGGTKAGAMTLLAVDAATLAPRGQLAVPAGTLGPLDPAGRALLYFGADGMTYRIPLDGALDAATLTVMPDLPGAFASGWNAALGHTYRATATDLEALDTSSGALLGALPVMALQPVEQPLAVDAARGLLYVPAAGGAVLIVRDGPAGALNAATALLLARAALPRFLPDTNQDPPFVAAETFPVAADSSAAGVGHDFWIHFSDLGWRGPYSGSVGVSSAPDPHHAGGYLVTFHIAWYQLFARSHTWVCAVAPDGTVALQSESGDAVP